MAFIIRWLSTDCVVPSSCNAEPVSMDKVHYCERFIELMIDLEVRHLTFYFC